jgi:threonine dehydrogenase-like Zn-dependent dehydrogenase
MRAAVTREPNVMEMDDVPDAREPATGEALLRIEAVGLCGSDYHLFTGEIGSTTVHGPQFPKIQGHEVSAVIERLGPDAPSHLAEGQRVAIWPLRGCGECYACSIGRSNTCQRFSLIGVHVNGALAERLTLPVDQLFPVGDIDDPAVVAFVEPISIAVHAVNRLRVGDGERVVVLGAGPIGQALAIVSIERGAQVLLVDLVASRLELGRLTGADVLDGSGGDVVAEARAWAGGEGPQVVFDAVGSPAVVQQAVELVVAAGRVGVVGLSDASVELPMGMIVAKELDILGTSVCNAEAFAEAAQIAVRKADVISKLISRRFPLEQAPEAITWAMANPQEALKVVVEV